MTYQQKKEIIKVLFYILLALIGLFLLLKAWIESIVLLSVLALLAYYYIKINHVHETTLCLIVKNEKVLMMLRNKKKNDVHLNKYNGLGGRVEKGESKTQCVLREVYEEAGVKLTKYDFVGKVEFKNFGYKIGKEIMYCFVGYEYDHEIGQCNEGDLAWIPKEKIMDLPLWEGDQYFLMDIILNKRFKAFLHYDKDKVVNHKIIYKR